MDGFGSDFSAGGAGGKVDTGTIMEQVKVQIAVANAQELLQRMTDKCFKKCIGKPGSTLDNSEQKCIAMCMDRYMDAWNTVSRTYNSRLQRERARMWTSLLLPSLPRGDAYSEEEHTVVAVTRAVHRCVVAGTHRLTSVVIPHRRTKLSLQTLAITVSPWTFSFCSEELFSNFVLCYE